MEDEADNFEIVAKQTTVKTLANEWEGVKLPKNTQFMYKKQNYVLLDGKVVYKCDAKGETEGPPRKLNLKPVIRNCKMLLF